jgi:hypothetical protein
MHFVWLLNQAMTDRVENLDGAADNLKHFVSEQQPVIISAHSCSFVVVVPSSG